MRIASVVLPTMLLGTLACGESASNPADLQQLTIPGVGCARLSRNGVNYSEIQTESLTISANIYGADRVERVTCSFSLSDLAGREVRKATLRFVQDRADGTPWDNGLMPVVVDWLAWTGTPSAQDRWTGMGEVSTLAANIGVLSNQDVDGAENTLNVTSRIISDLQSSRTDSRYRVRFLNDDTGGSGSVLYYKDGAGAPKLIVEYVSP